jgi:hypothetical protein
VAVVTQYLIPLGPLILIVLAVAAWVRLRRRRYSGPTAGDEAMVLLSERQRGIEAVVDERDTARARTCRRYARHSASLVQGVVKGTITTGTPSTTF